jgi:hypothetical protein
MTFCFSLLSTSFCREERQKKQHRIEVKRINAHKLDFLDLKSSFATYLGQIT